MATYAAAIEWIALNDGAGDTPEGMSWDEALDIAQHMVTAVMVADVFDKDQQKVGEDILRLRGFKKPRKTSK
jgi:hypothetical protein